MTRQRPWTTDLYQPHTGHMSQSVRPDPVWSSLNQPATLLIWTWIERWDWTILIFWFSLTLTSLIPPFLYQSRIPGFEKWPWKVAKPLHHYSCLSSPQRSFELIFSNWQHGFVLSFDQQLSFKSYSVLPGGDTGKNITLKFHLSP